MKIEVVLYGVGDIANKTWDFLKNRYKIIYVVDGNPEIIGEKWKGKRVYSPEKLRSYAGDIMVATSEKNFLEICQNLLHLGIERDRIFRVQQKACEQTEEIIPLVYLDRLSQFEIETIPRFIPNSVLVFCTFYSAYAVRLIRNMKKRYPMITFGILSATRQYAEELSNYADYIYVYHSYNELEKILRDIPKFSVFQLLWIENIWVSFSQYLRMKCKKLNLCIGGSDFYRASKMELEYKRKLIDISDNVSGETDDIILDFLDVYPEAKNRIKQVNFGIDVLNAINKLDSMDLTNFRYKYDLPDDKIIITCGYNGHKSHQHIKMIESLKKIDKSITENVCFIFPMTYPENNDTYIKTIDDVLKNTMLSYRILTSYMDEKDMATFAKISDILVHVQTTDQLSSTMLEAMYANSIVVTGAWLPYNMLKKQGFRFIEIKNIDELSVVLVDILDNLNKLKELYLINREKVYELSSWDNTSRKWAKLWSDDDDK